MPRLPRFVGVAATGVPARPTRAAQLTLEFGDLGDDLVAFGFAVDEGHLECGGVEGVGHVEGRGYHA